MASDVIYGKLEKGQEEIRSRHHGLSQKVRTVLISVDGKRSAGVLARQLSAYGDVVAMLEELAREGFIGALTEAAPAAPALDPRAAGEAEQLATQALAGLDLSDEFQRFRGMYKFMTEAAAKSLGLRALTFQLKLERCANLSDLKAVVPDFIAGITKARGADFGEAYRLTLQELAG